MVTCMCSLNPIWTLTVKGRGEGNWNINSIHSQLLSSAQFCERRSDGSFLFASINSNKEICYLSVVATSNQVHLSLALT